jgi:hypothetical protein
VLGALLLNEVASPLRLARLFTRSFALICRPPASFTTFSWRSRSPWSVVTAIERTLPKAAS